MANGLTALDNSIYNSDFRYLNKIQKNNNFDIDKAKRKFSDLLVESGATQGKVDVKKLDGEEKKMYDQCVEMESFLWKQVLNSMKKTINKTKLIDGGQTEEMFSDFLYDEYASMMAKDAGSNISDVLFKQLSGYRT